MEAVLDAIERTSRGKNEARRLRVTGKIPAVVYGGKDGGKAIAVDPKMLAKILRTEQGANTLIALNVPGAGDARVLVREYQLDPVTQDRKSTRLNSSHLVISYAVFCLKKKKDAQIYTI